MLLRDLGYDIVADYVEAWETQLQQDVPDAIATA